MKGVVFTLLADMVEDVHGLSAWDAILRTSGHSGIYVASETYPDAHMTELLSAAESVSGQSVSDLLRAFGTYAFPKFYAQIPHLHRDDMGLLEFLAMVDKVIHVEVRKLHSEVSLPQFDYEAVDEQQLTMYYRSPRRLCMLSEGLIEGAAAHFDTQYALTHDVCMHDGADHCRLCIRIVS